MIVLLIGPSGSGKDTQADLLRDHLGYEVISTGQLLRNEMDKDTDLGKEIKSYYDTGVWAPDETVYKLVGDYLEKSTSTNFVFTGAIRRVTQIEFLDDVLEKFKDPIDLVINFVLDEKTAIERLFNRVLDPETGDIYHKRLNPPPANIMTVQRSDDTPQAIAKRLSEYNKYNDEIIKEYSDRAILQNIDASGTVKSIHSKIQALINDLEK